jgi:hypothetical protein
MTNVLFSVTESQKLSGLSRTVFEHLKDNQFIEVKKGSRIKLDYFEVLKMSFYKVVSEYFSAQYSRKLFKALSSFSEHDPTVKSKMINNTYMAFIPSGDGAIEETYFLFFDNDNTISVSEEKKFEVLKTNITQADKLKLSITTDINLPPTETVVIPNAIVIYLKGIRDELDNKGTVIKDYDLKKTSSKYYVVS